MFYYIHTDKHEKECLQSSFIFKRQRYSLTQPVFFYIMYIIYTNKLFQHKRLDICINIKRICQYQLFHSIFLYIINTCLYLVIQLFTSIHACTFNCVSVVSKVFHRYLLHSTDKRNIVQCHIPVVLYVGNVFDYYFKFLYIFS